MSRRVIIAIVVVFALGLSGGGILGWMFLTRDRVALLSYRVGNVEGMSMQAVVTTEERLLESQAVLAEVIANLNLVQEWRMDSEEEAIAHMREKLIVREERIGSRIRVLYRDRKQERAFAVLKEIKKVFPPVRAAAVRRQELPPIEAVSADEEKMPSRPDPVSSGP